MSIFLDDDILLWCLYSQWAVLYTEEASFTVTHTQYYLQCMVGDDYYKFADHVDGLDDGQLCLK
jgi:hypothetical protein